MNASPPEATTATATRYKVLVVDDESRICELLASVLQDDYDVETALRAEEALLKIREADFDLVVTDLKLPDGNGIGILEEAKKKDPYCEVIIVTAFASLDTAAAAVNLNATSYLRKPISMKDFTAQVDRAIANRDFHKKSIMLKEHYTNLNRAAGEHIANITDIYELSRKLMFTLESREIIRTLLWELNQKLQGLLCVMAVRLFSHAEIYAMPRVGQLDEQSVRLLLSTHWEEACSPLEKRRFMEGNIPLHLLDGEGHEPGKLPAVESATVPLIVMADTIGSISVFRAEGQSLSGGDYQFLHVFSSFVSPLIENAYIHKQTKHQAATDALTGIYNHRSFQELLSREIARSNRDKSSFSLIILDIDNFKRVNDTYGHLVGDALLQDLTRRLRATVREQDVLARYGGEEFAVILPNTQAEGGHALAERIRTAIAGSPFTRKETSIPYTVSIGLSLYNGKIPVDREELIRTADDALYVSKNEGKNRTTVR